MAERLNIDAKALRDEGSLRFVKPIPAEDLQDCLSGQGRFFGPARLDAELNVIAGRVNFKGTLTGLWELECPRCVAHAPMPYEAKVSAVLPGNDPGCEAFEEARQALILAVPARPYCREDCKGLCPACGANRNERECGCSTASPILSDRLKKQKS